MKTTLVLFLTVIITLFTLKHKPPVSNKQKTNNVVKKLKAEHRGNESLQEKLNLVENYLDISGTNKNFSIPEIIIEKHINSHILKGRFTNEERENLTHFFGQKLNPDRIANLVKKELMKNFSVSELKELSELYEIDLMQKLRSTEEYYSSDEAMEKAKSENTSENSPERNTLLKELILTQEADLFAKELTLESIKGLHKGLHQVLPEKKRVPDEKAKLALKIISQTPSKNFGNTLLFRYQYQFQDFSEMELKNLIKISNNHLIRKARRALMTGIKTAFLTTEGEKDEEN